MGLIPVSIFSLQFGFSRESLIPAISGEKSEHTIRRFRKNYQKDTQLRDVLDQCPTDKLEKIYAVNKLVRYRAA
jgi:hypothetical protein